MINDHELGVRLAQLDPARDAREPGPLFDDLLRTVSTSRGRKPRRLKLASALIVSSVVVIGVGALPAVAAIQDFLAQVVENPPGEGSEVIPDSAWIDTGTSDLGEFVASRYPESLPLPGGVDRGDVVDTVAFSIGNLGGITQDVGVDLAYESYVYCRWVDVWLTADANGAADDRAYAAGIMMDATKWPALVRTDGGGVVDSQIKFAQAAASGDSAEVLKAFEYNACPAWKSMGSQQ